MSRGVFVLWSDWPYDDQPEIHCQFPSQSLSRASQFVGGLIIYYEPVKAGARGYTTVLN
jgi:putative restriction endonuclease